MHCSKRYLGKLYHWVRRRAALYFSRGVWYNKVYNQKSGGMTMTFKLFLSAITKFFWVWFYWVF